MLLRKAPRKALRLPSLSFPPRDGDICCPLFWNFRGAGSFDGAPLFGRGSRTGNHGLWNHRFWNHGRQFRPYLLRCTDKPQKHQSIERARGLGLGQPTLCHDVFGRNVLGGDEAEQAPLSVFQVLGLKKAQRVRRGLNLKLDVLGELLQRQVTGFAHGRQEQPSQRHRDADFREHIFFKRAEQRVAPGRIVEHGRGDLQHLLCTQLTICSTP